MRHLLAIPLLATVAWAPAADTITTPELDFEVAGAWVQGPAGAWAARPDLAKLRTAWHTRPGTATEIPLALPLEAAGARHGRSAGRWRNHPSVPAIGCDRVPADWSAARTLSLEVDSALATGAVITVAVRSDDPATPAQDWLVRDLAIDWAGHRTVHLPLASFTPWGRPAGWASVQEVRLLAAAAGRTPDPATDLRLDHLRLGDEGPATPAPAGVPADGLPRYTCTMGDAEAAWPVGHDRPEADPARAAAPIEHRSYFRSEGAVAGWFPAFRPGYPAVDAEGGMVINAGTTVQWRGRDGAWHASDVRQTLRTWAATQGWAGIHHLWGGQGGDPTVRFDRQGDAYLIAQVEPLDAEGRRTLGWQTRTALLLHSRDRLATWAVHRLPGRTAAFEKMEAWNQDALARPPVVLVGDYKHFAEADQGGRLLRPRRRGDGSLELPEPIRFAAACIDTSYHSGDGSAAVTVGNRVFVTYGWSPAHRASLTPETLATRPPIPTGHPGAALPFADHGERGEPRSTATGTPAYVVEVDPEARTVSAPVYVGSAGWQLDAHNWPSISRGPDGRLHVLVNGHHDPFLHTVSAAPDAIGAWEAPALVFAGDPKPNASYAAPAIDRSGTLHVVVRSTRGVYDNHLGYYRKRPGQPWEAERTLVSPFKRMYSVWYHRLVYDPVLDRLFLAYCSMGGRQWLSDDMLAAFLWARPGQEDTVLDAVSRDRNAKDPAGRGQGGIYAIVPGGPALLVSGDGGGTWRLATSADITPR